MKTEEYIRISEESLEKLKLLHMPELNEKEKNIMNEIVNLSRDFFEINQLFDLFLFNSLALEDTFLLKYDDKLERIRYTEYDCNDLILLNSLTINYISSGVTFLKSLEDFFKHNLNNEMYIKFKDNCLSKKYDTCFSYRLFDLLRNYSQHGHLIVSYDDAGYCFDLNQIANNPYFNYKKIMLNEMNDIIKKFLYKVGEYPCIAFTRTIAEYKLCLSEIYLKFLQTIEKSVFEKYREVNELLEKRPEIINKSIYEEFDNSIVYETNEEKIHIAKISDDFDKVFYNIKNKVIDIKKDDKKVYNDIQKSFKIISKY